MSGLLFRTDGPNTVDNQWSMFTGANNAGLTEKFRLFVPPGGITPNSVNFQASMGNMLFHTFSQNPAAPGPVERIHIDQGLGGDLQGNWNVTQGVTKVRISHDGFGVGYAPPPVAMLNIGESFPTTPGGPPNTGAGNRAWMDVGTYYASNSDDLYVGFKDFGNNRKTPIISWGNDPSNNANGDRLLYVFTAAPGNGPASGVNGLELSRMWSNGNIGRIGMGGDPLINLYSTSNIDPQQTLEVNSILTSSAAGAPGLLVINNHPQHPNFGLPTGLSGLRFTDLTSASVPERNDSSVVLSVNLNGDVVLVPGVPQAQFLALEARLAQTEKRLAELEGWLFALAACEE